MAKLSGGCACRSIRYEAAAEPMLMLKCHCRDCQQATGSGYAAIVVLPKDAVMVTGEPRFFRRVGDNGGAVERGTCPTCGSPVVGKLERLPDVTLVLAGSLDDPSMFKPEMDIFTASAHPWDHMDPALPKRPYGL